MPKRYTAKEAREVYRAATDERLKTQYPRVIKKIKKAAKRNAYAIHIPGWVSDDTRAQLEADGFVVKTLTCDPESRWTNIQWDTPPNTKGPVSSRWYWTTAK